MPARMSRLELYRGYRDLITRLYDFRNFRRRTLDYILNRGTAVGRQLEIGRQEMALLRRILWRTLVRTSPRRAWFTLSLLGTTLVRRPRRVADAVAFAIIHQGLHDYVRALCRHLDRAIAELEAQPSALATQTR
jgi:hypothetical protein